MLTDKEDSLSYLENLKRKNKYLQGKLHRLNELDKKLSIQTDKVNEIFETMLESEESQCVDMVEFDKDIKTLHIHLLKQHSNSFNFSSRREEHANVIMSHIMQMQNLLPNECETYLLDTDPILKGLQNDTNTLHEFFCKYSSFLV